MVLPMLSSNVKSESDAKGCLNCSVGASRKSRTCWSGFSANYSWKLVITL